MGIPLDNFYDNFIKRDLEKEYKYLEKITNTEDHSANIIRLP